MRARLMTLAAAVAASAVLVSAQANGPAPAGPVFDVVSIKKNTSNSFIGSAPLTWQGGRATMTNQGVGTLIVFAYLNGPMDLVGLPSWTPMERYDLNATSSLSNPTPEERIAMLRAMLADRFKLVVHVEPREQQVFDLLVARADRKLGSGLVPIDSDCAKVIAERAAAGPSPLPPTRPDFTAPPGPCMVRVVDAAMRDRAGDKQGRLGNLMEGETTMDSLANMLRLSTGMPVVNKTGLPGSYRVTMNYDLFGSRRGPEVAAAPDAPPTVFTAVREQLGLKLETSKATRDALVIDRLEHPTEN